MNFSAALELVFPSLRCAQRVGQRADTRGFGGTDAQGTDRGRASAHAHDRQRGIQQAPFDGGRRFDDRVFACRLAWSTLISVVERQLRGGRRAVI